MTKKLLPTRRLLLFGGTGSVGKAIRDHFHAKGWQVVVVSRAIQQASDHIQWDPTAQDGAARSAAIKRLIVTGPFEAICWAQGMNCSDSVYDFDPVRHGELYNANVLYVLNSLQVLLGEALLCKPARLCVISSIWQDMARQSKLSYCVTKSALHGLVLSAAADLARDGHVINAILPGVIDTPMTRLNLTPEQIRQVEGATLFRRLPTLGEVASCVFSLCGQDNSGITGQFINVDLGYSGVRVI